MSGSGCGKSFANDNIAFKSYRWKPIRLTRLALPKGHVARTVQNPSTIGTAPRVLRGFKPAVFTPEELGVAPTPDLHAKRIAAERLARHQLRYPPKPESGNLKPETGNKKTDISLNSTKLKPP